MFVDRTDKFGLFVVRPDVFEDRRGYFFESYNGAKLLNFGISNVFVQDNESYSVRNTIRGLHYQLNPGGQAKLVRVVCGEIYDVVVDLRFGSSTLYEWEGVTLSAANGLQLLVPVGFAHGFVVRSDYAVVCYKCDNFYCGDLERGILFSDGCLGVDWGIGVGDAVVSDRDVCLPVLGDAEMNFYV